MPLTDQVAAAIGGGRGLGEGICPCLAGAGAHVVVSDINFPNKDSSSGIEERDFPKVMAVVLIIYGPKDIYGLSRNLNNTWEGLEKELRLVTLPEVGHFVRRDAADLVTH